MGIVERFRIKSKTVTSKKEFEIPEALTIQVTEKLLDDLKSGFNYEYRSKEYNDEELDEFQESGFEHIEDDEEDNENRQEGLEEGMKVILKGKGKYYLIHVYDKAEGRFWIWKNGLHVTEHVDPGCTKSYTRAVFFHADTVDPRVTSEWRSKNGDDWSWLSLNASPQQTLDIFSSLMKARVDPVATNNYFRKEQEREKNNDNRENYRVYWPIKSTP